VRAWWLIAVLGCGRGNFDPCGLDAQAGSIERVQVQTPGAQTTAAISIPINVTAGNIVFVATYFRGLSNNVPVSDVFASVWRSLPVERSPCVAETTIQLWYAPIKLSGADSINLQQTSASNEYSAFVAEYAGIDTTTPLELSSGSFASATTTTLNAGTLATSRDALMLAMYASETLNSIRPEQGWLAIGRNDAYPAMLVETTAGPGTYSPTASVSVADMCWVAVSAAFRAAQ